MELNELKEWREVARLTQDQLAEKLGVASDTVSQWELGARAIPSHLHLALDIIKDGGQFRIVFLNYDAEIEDFNFRNKGLMDAFETFNVAQDRTLIQIAGISMGQNINAAIYMLCRLCVRHYEAVLLLVMCGHGFSAGRVLRSSFEKYVDAMYLALNPSENDDFWDFALFALLEERGADFVKDFEPEYTEKMKRFIGKNGGRRPQWSRANMVAKAKAIGADEFMIQHGYKNLNQFVHSSMTEIISSFTVEKDGSPSPAVGANDQERMWADVFLKVATHIQRNVLKLLIEHFELEEPKEFKTFFDLYDAGFKPLA